MARLVSQPAGHAHSATSTKHKPVEHITWSSVKLYVVENAMTAKTVSIWIENKNCTREW